jgi:hypothetical protein
VKAQDSPICIDEDWASHYDYKESKGPKPCMGSLRGFSRKMTREKPFACTYLGPANNAIKRGSMVSPTAVISKTKKVEM